jgi:hypothetical protein
MTGRVEHVSDSTPNDYFWLFDLLWGSKPAVTWAPTGELPVGFEPAEQFAVVHAGAGRSFTVSLASRRGTAAALTTYNALRPLRPRVARRLLGSGLRTGLAQPFLRTRIDVGTAAGATTGELPDALLGEHLSRIFGERRVVIAFGGGSGPYRKPVLQVFGTDGTPLGYVKVGWNDWTRDAVRREAAALRACALSPMRLGAPTLLDQSSWKGLDLVVTAPLPPGVRRLGRNTRIPETALLREIIQLSSPYVGELATSPWWVGLRKRIETGVADPGARSSLAQSADRIEGSSGRVPLEFGTWHGDLVPWNMARLGTRLYAWDWESSSPEAPVGFDALHFHFQVAFVARRLPLEEAEARAVRDAGPALGALGLGQDARRFVATLHMLELFVRHEEARSSAGCPDDRFYPAVTRLLAQSLALPPGAQASRCTGRSA